MVYMAGTPLCIPPLTRAIPTPGRDVMLFESDPYTRVSLMYLLSQAGFSVSGRGSYREALELVLERQRVGAPFNLLVLDMQPLSLSMIALLRSLEIRVPAVITTPFPNAEYMEFCRTLPNVAVVLRPYESEELLTAICRMCNT